MQQSYIHIKKYRKIILVFALVILFFPLSFSAQNKDITAARNLVLIGNINDAIIKYDKLVKNGNYNKLEKDGKPNTTIMMEYAYALALGGLYENALLYLDRAILLKANAEIYFYSAQVLSLMGYADLASEFWKEGGTVSKPQWLGNEYLSLQQKFAHKEPAIINHDHDSIAYKRANTLAAKGMYLQSIVLFQELTDKIPDLFFPYIGYSTIWESIGMYGKAAQELEKGIILMNIQKDSTLNDALSAFKNHLSDLKGKTITLSSNSLTTQATKETTIMLNGGLMIAKSFFSFNGRIGYFLVEKVRTSTSVAFNLGVSGGSGSAYFNTGLSLYKRYRFLMVGAGLNASLGKSSTFGFQWSGGFCFMNRTGKSSFDILYNQIIPIPLKDSKILNGFSIGLTYYLGTRKSNKK